MQPFDLLGVPSPNECWGMVGLLVSILLVLSGWRGVVAAPGTTVAFALIASGVVLGISSFMYCLMWGQSPTAADWQ